MKTRHIIFLALCGFLLLFYIALKKAGPHIENSVRVEINNILSRHSLSDVNVLASGRDIALSGQVKTEAQLGLLDSLVSHVPGVRVIENLVLVAPQPIIPLKIPRFKLFFKPNAFNVTFMHKLVLQYVITFLQSSNRLALEVNGYTDVEGDENYNLQLSEKRARNVYDHLLKNGIPDDLITLQYFGETDEEAGKGKKNIQAKNRKVEVIIREVK